MYDTGKVVVKVGNQTIPTCLGEAYNASMTARTLYSSLDSYLSKNNVSFKDIRPFLLKQYSLNGLEVQEGKVEDRQIKLYLDHVKRTFNGKWSARKDKRGKKGKGKTVEVRVSKLTKKRAEKLLSLKENLELLIKELEEMGYKVEKKEGENN